MPNFCIYTEITNSTHWEYTHNLLLTDALLPLGVGEKLLKLNKLLSELGHRLILCNTAPATKGIFKVTGLDVVFEFPADEPTAFALIKKLQPVRK